MTAIETAASSELPSAEHPGTVHAWFEQCAARYPHRTAVVFHDERLTYRELDERANQLARALKREGVTRETIVGLQVPRSLEMIIGILAILKAGGAYLPIDPEYPPSRIEYMLSHSRASLLLTPRRPDGSGAARIMDPFDQKLYQGDGTDLASTNTSSDMAYVIYTSGSTGTPKGVVIEHRSVVNYIGAAAEQIDFSPGKRILCLTTISFDIFVMESLLPLTQGMTIVIVDEREQADVELLKQRIVASHIDMLQLTPSRLQLLIGDGEGLECLQHIRELLVGGEAFPDYLFARLQDCSCKVYNLYGPTETTVYSLIKLLAPGQKITIGRPIANTQVYVVDAASHLQPVGAEGELLIGGMGLARGYLYAPELTAEKFVQPPFSPHDRVYRTGDRARWTAEGEIEFLGRLDRQVKLRGYRIELGEIESLLLAHDQIKAAAVEIWNEPSHPPYLCAYVVPRLPACPGPAALREYLAQKLPGYMVPAFFVRLDALPLTPNGKMDRRALPKPAPDLTAPRVAPRTELEKRIAGLWGDVLGFREQPIGVTHSFFDLGGNSLSAGRLIARMHREFGVRIPMAVFFEHATIQDLAAHIAAAGKTVCVPIPPAAVQEESALSPEQSRLFILHQLAPQSLAYNLPEMYRVEGELDCDRVQEAFQKLVDRHESFRTCFEIRDGVPIQKVHSEIPFQLQFYKASEEAVPELVDAFIRPFDLRVASLLRAGVVRTGTQRYYFMLDMHHIIMDGVSRDILIKDFLRLYAGEPLPPLRIQYRDYLEWRSQPREAENVQKHRPYWIKMFEGDIPPLNLPIDYPRPGVRRFQGRRLQFDFGQQATTALKELAREENASLFMVLFALMSVLLFKLTGQEDMVVGTPVAGRDHVDLEPIIGLFVNTLALRTRPQAHLSFREFLRDVRAMLLEALEHQDYPFDALVDGIGWKRDPSHNALFDVMFVLEDTETQRFHIPGATWTPFAYEHKASLVDLTIYMSETNAGLLCTLEYDTDLFKRSTIELLRDRFRVLLENVLEHSANPMADLEYRTGEEQALDHVEKMEWGDPL